MKGQMNYKIHLYCYEDETDEMLTITADSIDEAKAQCEMLAKDWLQEGDWGTDGYRVRGNWTLFDHEAEKIDSEDVDVDIEPDHETQIKKAVIDLDSICGTDPSDHYWTTDGEGGCEGNPGVLLHEGTLMSFNSHCRRCGLHRITRSNYDHSDFDTVEYRMLTDEEIAHKRANGDMDDDPEADAAKWVYFLQTTSYQNAISDEIDKAWSVLIGEDATEIDYPEMWARLQEEVDAAKWVYFLQTTSYEYAPSDEIDKAWSVLIGEDATEIDYPEMWARLQEEVDPAKWVAFLQTTNYENATSDEINKAWSVLIGEDVDTEIDVWARHQTMWARLQEEAKLA
jgi:hypothetical protein